MKKTIAAERHFAFNRRLFLRGLGACIALPAFESAGALKLLAAPAGKLATTATGAPLRTAFVYFPNGAIQPNWWPKGEGKEFELAPGRWFPENDWRVCARSVNRPAVELGMAKAAPCK